MDIILLSRLIRKRIRKKILLSKEFLENKPILKYIFLMIRFKGQENCPNH